MCALPLVYVHVTVEYPLVPVPVLVLVLVQPQVQLQVLILLQDLAPKLALVLESQEPGQAARLVQVELEAEPQLEQEQPPE